MFSQNVAERLTHNLHDGLIKDWLNDFVPEAVSVFWSVILAIIIWIIVSWIMKLFRKACMRSLVRHDAEEGVQQFLDGLLRAIGVIIAIVLILGLFGVTTGTIVAAVGSLGVTAGLALQGSLSNFAGGVLILVLHPFRVGDYIIEDTHKNEGTVTEITIFYTKLATVDNRIVVVPNGELATTSLTNVTKDEKRMINASVTISYEDDIVTAKSLIEEVIKQEVEYMPEEPLLVFVTALGDHGVEIGYRFYVHTDEYWAAHWRVMEAIKYCFDEHGISIPYNHLDVMVKGHH